MNFISKIPDEVKCITLKANTKAIIDTKGLCCTLKPSNCDVFVKAKASEEDADAFIVRSGESLDFCSSVTVFANTDTSIYCMFYNTL